MSTDPKAKCSVDGTKMHTPATGTLKYSKYSADGETVGLTFRVSRHAAPYKQIRKKCVWGR
jgi:hypothetical protein